jgi:hypothetical protein
MSVREISVKNLEKFVSVGFYPLISKYVPGALKESMLPLPVKLKDLDSGKLFDCQLRTLIPFQSVIPETLAFIAENKIPDQKYEQELLARHQVQSINQLGFYLYAFNS